MEENPDFDTDLFIEQTQEAANIDPLALTVQSLLPQSFSDVASHTFLLLS